MSHVSSTSVILKRQVCDQILFLPQDVLFYLFPCFSAVTRIIETYFKGNNYPY